MTETQPQETAEEEKKTGKNALEWTVFGLSFLLLTSVFGYLIYQSFHYGAAPPRLEVSLGQPVKAGTRILVPVKVENRGQVTAASVEIEVERRGGKETAHFSLPHLPRGGEREGWVAFDAPLRKEELRAKIVGYEEP